MQIDFGRTAKDYGQYRAGFPDAFFDRLAAFGIGQPGQRVLDVGTGTGTIARGLARRGCAVTALDTAPQLLDQARQLDAEAGVQVHYLVAKAEDTGLTGGQFAVVTAGQCWHWFDRPRAAAEVMRLLIPGGKLVIAHFDWIPLPGNVVEMTERLILKHNPRWHMGGGTGLYPAWLTDMGAAGFTDLETFSFDTCVLYSQEAWRGRIRASAGVAASLPPEQVARFDDDLKGLLETHFPVDYLSVDHRVFAVIGQCSAETL
ncbi:MAG: methyltransferase domain-containing protein [Anaerolineae bacterium]|nr:methyltransferase domain-containing protein [Anaerolineae bacterium]